MGGTPVSRPQQRPFLIDFWRFWDPSGPLGNPFFIDFYRFLSIFYRFFIDFYRFLMIPGPPPLGPQIYRFWGVPPGPLFLIKKWRFFNRFLSIFSIDFMVSLGRGQSFWCSKRCSVDCSGNRPWLFSHGIDKFGIWGWCDEGSASFGRWRMGQSMYCIGCQSIISIFIDFNGFGDL